MGACARLGRAWQTLEAKIEECQKLETFKIQTAYVSQYYASQSYLHYLLPQLLMIAANPIYVVKSYLKV